MTKTRKRRCPTCGKLHDELLTDIASTLPDAIWELGYLERYKRARTNPDFCTLDERRYFVRCVLPINFTDRKGFFGWGLWVEVAKKDHDRVVRDFDAKKEQKPFKGRLANNVAQYGRTLGLEVIGRPCAGHRPLLYTSELSKHPLAIEQRLGIDTKRHHEIVEEFA